MRVVSWPEFDEVMAVEEGFSQRAITLCSCEPQALAVDFTKLTPAAPSEGNNLSVHG